MPNDGKHSEKIFRQLYKKAFVYRFLDHADIKGISENFGTKLFLLPPCPSDFIVVDPEEGTFFAEVKSYTNLGKFYLSRLNKNQRLFADYITSLGGRYFIFLHDLATKKWYKIPYTFCKQGKKSMDLEELDRWHYK